MNKQEGALLPRLWSHRHLVSSLVRRQFQLRYRQSLGGFAWAVILPLSTLGAATLVFDQVMGVNTGRTPYWLFTLSALASWTFFANSLAFGIPSVVQAPTLVTRMPFPRAVLPLSMVGVSLIDFTVTLAIFVVLAYAAGVGLPWTALWVPVLLLIEIVLVAGIVLLGSALNVFARDVRLAVPLGVQLWLFLTPVMYPLDAVPERLRTLYLANPMTGLVESFRRILVQGMAPDPGLLLPALIGALGTCMVGGWYFSATERRFADVI